MWSLWGTKLLLTLDIIPSWIGCNKYPCLLVSRSLIGLNKFIQKLDTMHMLCLFHWIKIVGVVHILSIRQLVALMRILQFYFPLLYDTWARYWIVVAILSIIHVMHSQYSYTYGGSEEVYDSCSQIYILENIMSIISKNLH